MSTNRSSKIVEMRSLRKQQTSDTDQEAGIPASNELIRVLVLDHDRETRERIQNALWTWPHKIAEAQSVDEAISLCRHIEPAALMAAIDFPDGYFGRTISSLRERLPQVAIVALGSGAEGKTVGDILAQGADAFLLRDDIHCSTLHDLLTRIQQTQQITCTTEKLRMPQMSVPWRESKMIGALICDISGTIIDANACMASWLGYPDPDLLFGKCVWRDLLNSRADWSAWKKVAGDTKALLHQPISVLTDDGQNLWMKVEVFAAPSFPSYLQAVFFDQTELALLTGRRKGH